MDIAWHAKKAMVSVAVRMLKWTGWYEGYWKHWRPLFKDVEESGLHVLPVHFYSPVPDTRALPESLWDEPSDCPGVTIDWEAGLAELQRLSAAYGAEYGELAETEGTGDDAHRFFYENTAYGHGDAEVLYAKVRDLRPRRIVEIGSGRTTCLIAQAIRRNEQDDPEYACEFVAVEPYPPPYLVPPPAEVSRFEQSPLQQVDLALFQGLESGDLLFIDSSHVAHIGSDVVREYLEILPRLAPGVHVHIHDIFLPWEYPRRWVHELRFFWNEQYLLQAFLAHNPRFEVVLPLHGLLRRYPAEVAGCLPGFDPTRHPMQAFWMRSVEP